MVLEKVNKPVHSHPPTCSAGGTDFQKKWCLLESNLPLMEGDGILGGDFA